mmetsp:Transcript_20483/g.38520  ORF Transcript_20483/g.38520 Transcript_20483/m.38520 type:complete len:224 (-) Transcript_20483:291-962(-)
MCQLFERFLLTDEMFPIKKIFDELMGLHRLGLYRLFTGLDVPNELGVLLASVLTEGLFVQVVCSRGDFVELNGLPLPRNHEFFDNLEVSTELAQHQSVLFLWGLDVREHEAGEPFCQTGPVLFVILSTLSWCPLRCQRYRHTCFRFLCHLVFVVFEFCLLGLPESHYVGLQLLAQHPKLEFAHYTSPLVLRIGLGGELNKVTIAAMLDETCEVSAVSLRLVLS